MEVDDDDVPNFNINRSFDEAPNNHERSLAQNEDVTDADIPY